LGTGSPHAPQERVTVAPAAVTDKKVWQEWFIFRPVVRIRYPVPFWLLDPRLVKNQDPDPRSGSGINIPYHISRELGG
jgi:hypothetical protein